MAQPTGVIKIEVTDRPDGLCQNDGYDFREDSYATVLGGELRIFRKKVGAGITKQVPRDYWNDEETPQTIVDFRGTEEAEALNRDHYERTCSWLHRHTILDDASAAHVGRFLCPPPILFFEEGDIQLDINWKRAAARCMMNSCIIARRRTSSAPDPLPSHEMKFKEQMKSVQDDIDKLERKKDMIWLAYECAASLCDDTNDRALLLLPARDKKATRCVLYMDKVVFNEQLSLYGLRLENIEFVANGCNSSRKLTFSRITM